MEQIATFGEREASNDGAFLFRVAMFDLLPEEKRKEIIAARKAYLTARLRDLYKLEKAGRPQSFSGIVLEHFQDLVRDELQWISGLEEPKARTIKKEERHANR